MGDDESHLPIFDLYGYEVKNSIAKVLKAITADFIQSINHLADGCALRRLIAGETDEIGIG